ncbi:hypothetical protein BZA77DRAFT_374816 [Pyronema omphalodes]|nr:hypothetical protein BZA77DRAFT_374816 [Pyronema omphalodes]
MNASNSEQKIGVGFMSLPTAIHYEIFIHLDSFTSVVRLAQTCSYLSSIWKAYRNGISKEMLHRDIRIVGGSKYLATHSEAMELLRVQRAESEPEDIMDTVRRALKNASIVGQLSMCLFNDIPTCRYSAYSSQDPMPPIFGPWVSYGNDLLRKGLYKLWIRSLLKKEHRTPYLGFDEDAVYSNEMATFISTPDWYADMLRRRTGFPNVEHIIEGETEMIMCEFCGGLFKEAEAVAQKADMEKNQTAGTGLFNPLLQA